MARQPFYGRGPGPAIARMDMNAATAPGRAYGQMFANLGKIAGDSIEKYAEGKKKKEEQKQTASFIKRALINSPEIAAQFGIQGDDSMTFEEAVDQGSNAIAKDPKGFEMVKGFAAMAAQQRKAQQETELFNRKIDQFDRSQETADELKQAKGDFLGKFYSSVPTGEMNEAGQEEVANFQAFAAPEDPRTNAFIQETLQNPEFQQTEPVMDMTGNRFAQQFAGDSPEVQQLALNVMQARQKDAPSMSRLVTIQDGKGGFEQVGLNSAGDPIRSYGPPKPSTMFATPDQQADARAKTLSVDNANDFVNTQRNSALDSAKSIRPATRALTLLEKGELDTGGISEFKTNAIAMLDSLGIPMDKQTMDKVANTQNFRAEVGKFLFENISNTKGSISEKEMDIFAKISPGLQMTPEANKTLLNYVIKKAERDKDKVKFIQKMRRDGVSITEQRNKLEDYMLDNDLSEILSPIAGEPSEQQPFRSPQGDVNGKVVGTKPNGDKLIDVNGKIFVQPAQ